MRAGGSPTWTRGRDIDFIIPGPWAYGAPALAPHLTRGLYGAYHRYMAEYCAADPRRLKSMVLAPATDPAWAAQVITELAKEDWVAAVWPLLPEGLPVDDPDLEPIWAAANDADLANHADAVIAWRKRLGEPATQKLMWENATRFFRLTSTPWG